MASNVAARLAKLTQRLGEFDQVVVKVAGQTVYDALIIQLERDTGGDRALSGMAGGRYKMDVDITPLNNPAGVRLRPKGKTTGMWSIVSKGTSAHEVGAKRRRQRGKGNASRSRAMKIGGVWRTGPWRIVSGTSGKDTWPKGIEKGLDDARAKYAAEFAKVVAG